MKNIGVTLFLFAAAVNAQDNTSKSDGYAAVTAVNMVNGRVYTRGQLMMFPINGQLPVPLPNFGFSEEQPGADGRTWYGVEQGVTGIKRSDLISGKTTVLPGSESFASIDNFAVSPGENLVFVSVRDSSLRSCGFYTISEPWGQVKLITAQHVCTLGWGSSSISPDAKSVILERDGKIELLDLTNGSQKDVGDYEHAAWAPNGKWIAAFGGGQLVLLDPVTFRRVKSLGKEFDYHPAWSPDSHYLLVRGPACGPFYFSLSALDVSTGKRSEIKSASCVAKSTGYWFVSDKVYRAQLRAQQEKPLPR